LSHRARLALGVLSLAAVFMVAVGYAANAASVARLAAPASDPCTGSGATETGECETQSDDLDDGQVGDIDDGQVGNVDDGQVGDLNAMGT